MAIENMMYFALGLLIAALFATILMPAMWQRAVRLTKKRIEAATPVSMAEFRAEKDQLRAEHAIAVRRMETTIETLRRRLANELRDTSRRSVEADLTAQRRAHQEIVADFQDREDKLRRRALDVEKEVASLAQRLRMRERELEDKITELRALRTAQLATSPAPAPAVVSPVPLAIAPPDTDPVEALHGKISGLEQSILTDWPNGQTDEQALRTKLISIAEDVAALPPPP